MQALQRLFKLAQEKQAIKNSNIANKKESTYHAEEGKREIIHSNNQKAHKRSRKREGINLECNDLNKHLAALIRRACFSNTLHVYSVNIKKEDIIRGYNKSVSGDQPASSSPSTTTTQNVRNKVLPISDTSTTSSTRRRKQTIGNGENSNKPKAVSKMKELLRWSAAAKSQKGGKHGGIKVSHFRNGGSVNRLVSGDGELASESPKISFSLIPESCSTVGSDQCHRGPGKGYWITTDDECKRAIYPLAFCRSLQLDLQNV